MTVWSFEGRTITTLTFLAFVALLEVKPAKAEISCHAIYDPRYPGLKECAVTANTARLQATPPTAQQMPYWCWAASLSMIYGALGHSISQENVVLQNYHSLADAPGGDYVHFEQKLNRTYTDDSGQRFRSIATRINAPEEAAHALADDHPILYTTSDHATVQTKLVYQVAPGGPVVVKGGEIWDPNGGMMRPLASQDVARYAGAWLIKVEDVN